ncbi:MAG: NAD-dependent epimerase/dehydratase family protein [Candidatus Omnitrophica bacterium]|nr:NAD-dependent epimerase/dehydratase family protein [Candidatus Omnitrophota bacterium]
MGKRFWKDKAVFISGYEGFLGSNLAKNLIGCSAKIIGLDRVKNRPISVLDSYLRKNIICIKGDVGNLKIVRGIINKYKPRVIFHLAAEAIVGKAHKNPLKTFKSNIEGTWNILEACRDKKFIEAIVVASSDKAYGSHKRLPYEEGAPLKGEHPYDVSKSCADLISRAYYHTYNLPVAITRCGNIYGPGDFNFSRIIPDTIRCALSAKALCIRSDGKFIRDYIFVDDIVNGYILLAEKMRRLKLAGQAFNFSNDNPMMVIELVKKIYQLTGKDSNYRILNKARYEIERQYLSSNKARRILNWRPALGLEETLKLTIDWYRSLKTGRG